jgi:allophanate hydrolase subunit 2
MQRMYAAVSCWCRCSSVSKRRCGRQWLLPRVAVTRETQAYRVRPRPRRMGVRAAGERWCEQSNRQTRSHRYQEAGIRVTRRGSCLLLGGRG